MTNTTLLNPTSNKPKEVGKSVVLDTLENLIEKDTMGLMDDEHSLDNQPGISVGSLSFINPEATLEKAAATAGVVFEKVTSVASTVGGEFKDLINSIATFGAESSSNQNSPANQEKEKKQADYQQNYQIQASLEAAKQRVTMQTNEYLIENVLRGNENVISKEEVKASVNYNVTDVRTLDRQISEADARLLVEIRKQQIMASKKVEQQQEESEVTNKPVVQMNGAQEGGTAGGQANIQAVATAR